MAVYWVILFKTISFLYVHYDHFDWMYEYEYKLSITDYTIAIKCYRCTVGPTFRMENRTQQLCLKFTKNNDFTIDCPFSTMCMKQVYKYKLLDGKEIETVSRDCAYQKHTEQVYKEGAWQKENTVEEPYEEGCLTTQKDERSTIYCHCRGTLCNSAPKESPSYHTDAMAVIFVFNAMKYLRNLD